MEMNIKKYLDKSSDQYSPYGNGITYKDEKAFNAKNDEICYICEGSLEDLEDLFEEGKDLTDEELISQNYADSYNTIIRKIKESNIFDNIEETESNLHEIACYLFQNADWADITTYILEYEEAIWE